MISRLEAYRYRCFSELAVELGAYNVLAGANGSGKTTLLDIPVLLGDLLDQHAVSDAFLEIQPSRGVARAHTLDELIHREHGSHFAFAIEARLPAEVGEALIGASSVAAPRRPTHLRYEVRFHVVGRIELQVAEEYLFHFARGSHRPELGGGLQGRPESRGTTPNGHPRLRMRRPGWRAILRRTDGGATAYFKETAARPRALSRQVPSAQLALASLPFDRAMAPSAIWLRELLQQRSLFYQPDYRRLRRASPPGQPQRFLPDAQNVPWLALRLRDADPQRFGDWIEHVRTALPQVVGICVKEREEDHHAYFAVEYEGGHRVTSSGLSEGTLRVLALTLVPYLADPPAVLVTEEPETAIHPQAIASVLQSLSSVYDSQVWISTHSPVVLAQTDLAQMLCTRLDADGRASVVSGDRHPRLRDWQGSLDLGTLFAAGVLG